MRRSALTLAVCAAVSACALTTQAATSSELDALNKETKRNNDTLEGQRYQKKFLDAIDPAVSAAMEACTTKNMPNTKDGQPGEITFIVAADGRVKRVLYSENIPLAVCVASKLRSVSKLPPPPHDSYVVGVLAAKHDQPQEAKGPPDKPRRLRGQDQVAAMDKAIAPSVAKAKATYPAAKTRFLAGLPAGYKFSVRVSLSDRDGTREDSFVDVERISGGNITGTINSELGVVREYKQGQRITFPESKIDNWVIVRPDGTEEGNYVGKFLDHYKPQ